jgi:hypothetical protein
MGLSGSFSKMTKVNTFGVSFSQLLTFHFSLFTGSDNAAGLTAEPTPPK